MALDGTCVEKCNANEDDFTKEDDSKCVYDAECKDGKGLKKDGSCAATRDDCADDATFYFINTKDNNKCMLLTT